MYDFRLLRNHNVSFVAEYIIIMKQILSIKLQKEEAKFIDFFLFVIMHYMYIDTVTTTTTETELYSINM